jgi:hypothetical protein
MNNFAHIFHKEKERAADENIRRVHEGISNTVAQLRALQAAVDQLRRQEKKGKEEK